MSCASRPPRPPVSLTAPTEMKSHCVILSKTDADYARSIGANLTDGIRRALQAYRERFGSQENPNP